MEQPSFFGRNSRWLLPLLAIAGSGLGTWGLVAAKSEPPKKVEEKAAALVEVTEVEMEPLQLTVQSQGIVSPRHRTDLVAQVSGELVKIADAFVRGGIVKKGDLLAEIDPTNYQVRVEDAKAKLASAEAALELEEAQSQVAKAEWDKIHTTEAPALGLRKPQLAQAQAQVTAARAALKQAEKDLSRTLIVAPYDALVAGRDVSLGSFVNVGGQLGQVLDISTAEVRLPLANSDLQYLNANGVGAEVILSGDLGGQKRQWQARILRTEGVIDDESRMSYLVAGVEDPYLLNGQRTSKNAAAVLPFGSYVVADIDGMTLPSAASIPRYLIKDGRVAVAQQGKLTFKTVNVLRNVGGSSIVVDGLNSGDQLIATALDFPVEGMNLELLSPDTLPVEQPAAPAAVADTAQVLGRESR